MRRRKGANVRNTHLSVDELEVMGALGVTVTSSVLGTSLVRGVRRLSTV